MGGVKSSSSGLALRLAFGDGVTCRLSVSYVLVGVVVVDGMDGGVRDRKKTDESRGATYFWFFWWNGET